MDRDRVGTAMTELTDDEVFGAPVQPIQQPSQSFLPPVTQAPLMQKGAVEGPLEAIRSLITGVAAEPIAGLVGLGTDPFAGSEQASKNIE